jgi:hypothetical protein
MRRRRHYFGIIKKGTQPVSKRLSTYLFGMLLAAALALGIASPARALAPFHRHDAVAANSLVQTAHYHHHRRPRHHHHH